MNIRIELFIKSFFLLLLPFSMDCLAQQSGPNRAPETRQAAAIRVSPSVVNVNSQGATTVFLTFGGLKGYRPAEASWSGAVISASPDMGVKPDPATVFGYLPARYDQSKLSGGDNYTDIMSIPASIARKAYLDAAGGASSEFYYVRRFVGPAGAPDQYVAVMCRMSGGGARVPLSLTDVKLSFPGDTPVLFVKEDDKLPAVNASISYTGSGRLKGRWEVVMPGEEQPTPRDLLTEATLPVEERGLQRRYSQISRFNVFLPPTGRFTLPGPIAGRLPNKVEGMYLVLLRIEASDDREGDSDLAAAGGGTGIVHTGGVAGFSIPTLRYYVGGSTVAGTVNPSKLTLLTPLENESFSTDSQIDFSWNENPQAVLHRLEVTDAEEKPVFSAILQRGVTRYRAPSWLKDKIGNGGLRWRVVALDKSGKPVEEAPRRNLNIVRK